MLHFGTLRVKIGWVVRRPVIGVREFAAGSSAVRQQLIERRCVRCELVLRVVGYSGN